MAVQSLDLSQEAMCGTGGGKDGDFLRAPLVTAFLGRTERGPLDEPVLVRSFDQYQRIFGGRRPFSFVPHAVQHYFQHGGEAAVIVRVVNRASRARIDAPAGAQALHLQALQPGSRELIRISVDYDGCPDPRRFNLVVQRMNGSGPCAIEDQELFLGVSMNEADERFVVDALEGSALIRLVGPLPDVRPDATQPSQPGFPVPYVELTAPGSDGEELTDYDIIGSNTERTGLFALERVERVDVLCIPPPPRRDLGTTTFVAAERYCRQRRAMLIWDPPWTWQSVDAALMQMRSCPPVSPNALGYFPRLTGNEERQRFPDGLPACGALAGMLARRTPWSAQAHASGLRGGLRPLLDLSAAQVERLRAAGVNALCRDGAGQYVLQGNVTLAGANSVSSHRRCLDTRRTALFVVGSIQRLARRAAPEWGRVRVGQLLLSIGELLAAQHEQGRLAGRSASESFFVRTIESNAAGGESLRFGFALERAGDFLVYDVDPAAAGAEVRRVLAPAGRRRVSRG